MPRAPENGIIENMQSISTVGGSQIFFRCNPGYVPAGRMNATCVSSTISWTPNPANLMCNGKTHYMEQLIPHNTIVNSVEACVLGTRLILLVMLLAWRMPLTLISVEPQLVMLSVEISPFLTESLCLSPTILL